MNILTDTIVPVCNKSFVSHIISQIQTELSDNPIFKERRIKMLVTDMFIEIARNDYKTASVSFNNEFETINNVKEIVQNNYKSNWTLSSMAELSGYSVSHFTLLYKKYYKKSPIDDLIDRRINQAKFMMEGNTMTLS